MLAAETEAAAFLQLSAGIQRPPLKKKNPDSGSRGFYRDLDGFADRSVARPVKSGNRRALGLSDISEKKSTRFFTPFVVYRRCSLAASELSGVRSGTYIS